MELSDYYQGKRVLVTGGVGSIGKEIVRELLQYDIEFIRVLDNNETELFDFEQEINSPKIRPLIGDVRDEDRLIMAMDQVDIVFHAAALKHVPMCEYNPFDAVKTNVIGTQCVLQSAFNQGVQKVIFISTDKAVNPSNVMGATKLLGERLTISANSYQGQKKTVFSCVRFGNVLNSRGSVIPLFQKQIKKGGPVTITNLKMTRFVMDIPSAVRLTLMTGVLAQGREIFILKMPAITIIDLYETMKEVLAPIYGFNPDSINYEVIGMRDGEKMDETLMTTDETQYVYESNEMFLILPKNRYYGEKNLPQYIPEGFLKASALNYSSNNAPQLPKSELMSIIKNLSV